MARGIVYTAIFGVPAVSVREKDHGVRYEIFTDSMGKLKGWDTIHHIPKDEFSSRQRNRREKILFHSKAEGVDWTLYCDGNRLPHAGIADVVEKWLENGDIAMFHHPERSCAWEEVRACVRSQKMLPKYGKEAESVLGKMRHPKKWGLWAGGMIARRVGVEWLDELAQYWWKWAQRIPRDQIWLPPALRRSGMRDRMVTIKRNVFRNEWFRADNRLNPRVWLKNG